MLHNQASITPLGKQNEAKQKLAMHLPLCPLSVSQFLDEEM